MLLTLLCLVSAAVALPVSVLFDRRQDGELNISADIQNIVFLVAIPNKVTMPIDLIDLLKNKYKSQTRHSEAQDRADHVLEAFVEPDTPYQVEIGSDRSAGGGRAVEVVIAGKRRLETETHDGSDEIKSEPQVYSDEIKSEPQVYSDEIKSESQEGSDEMKLIGAREQCGPDRERDPDTLTCRFKKLDIEDIKPIPSPNALHSEPEKDLNLQKEPFKSSSPAANEERPQAKPEVLPA